ncbi:MAG: ParB N-terminal domain-containing protein, partial [Firmicutes bacterium]|nr:ParB N-terminal domain-containing protein [Bacillota bacterium]
MKIQMMRPSDLIAYENNPRLNDSAVDAVAASIKEFGFKVPIVITKDRVIIAGHTRLKASLLLNLEAVPCLIADDLTDDQIKAFRLVDNKTAELATWDLSKLETELFDIDMDILQFGFEEFESSVPDNASDDD